MWSGVQQTGVVDYRFGFAEEEVAEHGPLMPQWGGRYHLHEFAWHLRKVCGGPLALKGIPTVTMLLLPILVNNFFLFSAS